MGHTSKTSIGSTKRIRSESTERRCRSRRSLSSKQVRSASKCRRGRRLSKSSKRSAGRGEGVGSPKETLTLLRLLLSKRQARILGSENRSSRLLSRSAE